MDSSYTALCKMIIFLIFPRRIFSDCSPFARYTTCSVTTRMTLIITLWHSDKFLRYIYAAHTSCLRAVKDWTAYAIGTAHTVCAAGSMQQSGVRPSVRRTPLLRVCCCGPGGQEISNGLLTDRWSAAAAPQRRPYAGSATLSATVGSLIQTCY